MTSDLPGEPGALDPGLDQLFRALTAVATPQELAGEQDALAMFRANVRPPASTVPVGTGAASPVRDTTGAWRGTRGRFGIAAATSRRSAGRAFRAPIRWSVGLAAAAALALGGAAAAAYASALPAPVQHLAHAVLGFAGVPDDNPGSAPSPPRHHRHAGPASGHSATSPAEVTPAPTASGSAGGSPSASASPTPTASAPPAGPSLLSASAASAVITAGADAVIDGRLTRSGKAVPGVTVTLVERLAGHLKWRVAGTEQTNSEGNVAVQVAALDTNAVFRLTIHGAAPSAGVRVIVQPPIAAVLNPVPGSTRDVLAVSTQYARRGNVVVLQVQSADGSWAYLRSKRLNAAGQTTFILSGKRLKNREVRVVLLATVRHGESVLQNPILVPPPG